jgi:hypothetical protein
MLCIISAYATAALPTHCPLKSIRRILCMNMSVLTQIICLDARSMVSSTAENIFKYLYTKLTIILPLQKKQQN